jgi:hypothetical protein
MPTALIQEPFLAYLNASILALRHGRRTIFDTLLVSHYLAAAKTS